MCVLQKRSHCPCVEKGAVTMESKIIIHNDFCNGMSSEDIQTILSAVTELIAEAVVRSTAEQDDFGPAA